MKAVFRNAWPYLEDELNLPVENLETAIPFYETTMGFQVVSLKEAPHKSVVLAREGIQIGLAENGGDPTQEGCFFEVDNVETAFAELKANGLEAEEPEFSVEQYEDSIPYKVFFVIAPDGLCYCIGERQS